MILSNMKQQQLKQLKDKSVMVLGAGVSGKAAAIFAKAQGARVTVSNAAHLATADADLFSHAGINFQIGAQQSDLCNGFDILVTSPGIADDHPAIVGARERQLCVVSEIDLALAYFHGRLVAVTGTNGKSTTTAMVAHMLTRAGLTAVACGNIGLPPTQVLLEDPEVNTWVMELSSYQISIPSHCSDVVIFTSFSQDHMARHGSIEAYFLAKWQLCAAIKPGGLNIISRSAADQAIQRT